MYYPKSKIQTNLYTNGGELFYVSNLQEYVGYYYKTYDGKYFSGKSNDDVTSVPLTTNSSFSTKNYLKNNTNQQDTNVNILVNPLLGLEQILNLPTVSLLPSFIYPNITQTDYQNGRFERYFVKKSNEPIFIEIDKLQFERFAGKDFQYAWQFYIPITMTWLLTGNRDDVRKTNFRIASQIQSANKVYGFVKYLEATGGFDKFYK